MKKIRILSILLSCGLLTTSQISASKKFSSSDCLKFSPILLVPAAFIGAGYGIYKYQKKEKKINKDKIADQNELPSNNETTYEEETNPVVMEKDKSKINSAIDRCLELAFKYKWKYLKDVDAHELQSNVKSTLTVLPSRNGNLLTRVVKFCTFLTCVCIKHKPKTPSDLEKNLKELCRSLKSDLGSNFTEYLYEEFTADETCGASYSFDWSRINSSNSKNGASVLLHDGRLNHHFSINFTNKIAEISFIETTKLDPYLSDFH